MRIEQNNPSGLNDGLDTGAGMEQETACLRGSIAEACELVVEDQKYEDQTTARTVTFTIPERWKTLGDVLRAIEAANSGTCVIEKTVWDELADKLAEKVDPGKKYSISIHFDAHTKARDEQIDYLGERNFAAAEILVVAAALYRDRESADLFGDKFVRSDSSAHAILYRCGAVAVQRFGTYDDWADPVLIVASSK